jgi:hypothetical protein
VGSGGVPVGIANQRAATESPPCFTADGASGNVFSSCAPEDPGKRKLIQKTAPSHNLVPSEHLKLSSIAARDPVGASRAGAGRKRLIEQ